MMDKFIQQLRESEYINQKFPETTAAIELLTEAMHTLNSLSTEINKIGFETDDRNPDKGQKECLKLAALAANIYRKLENMKK